MNGRALRDDKTSSTNTTTDANLDRAGRLRWSYDDMRLTAAWLKYLVPDGKGWLYVPFGPPCKRWPADHQAVANSRVNPAHGRPELWRSAFATASAAQVRYPHRRLWVQRKTPATAGTTYMAERKLNNGTSWASISAVLMHQGDIGDRCSAWDKMFPNSRRRVVKLGAHIAPSA